MQSRRTRRRRAPARRARAATEEACGPLPALPQEIETARPESDEHRSDHKTARATAVQRRRHEKCEPEHRDRQREQRRDPAIERGAQDVVSFEAATITRQGACFSTKSTVSPKIARLPEASLTRRG